MKKNSVFKASQLAVLCYQMSLVFKSGISVVEGVHLLTEEIEDRTLKQVLDNVCAGLSEGLKIYEAFSSQPEFPDYMIKMIEIGELSGTLDDVMEHLSEYYEKIDTLNKKLQSAVTYPLVLMGLMVVIIGLLLVKVLPMFKDIIVSIGGEMPLITSYIMYVSDGLKQYGIWGLGILGIAIVGLIFYVRTPLGHEKLDRFKLRAPVLKTIFIKIYASKFSVSMALLLRSGISYTESLRMVAGIVGNSELEKKINIYRDLIINGDDDGDSFKNIGIFPSLLVRMIKIGHKTGELDGIMNKVATIYEVEVERELNRLTSSVEPILIIILSLVVGVILLTVMLPLINIMSSIG